MVLLQEHNHQLLLQQIMKNGSLFNASPDLGSQILKNKQMHPKKTLGIVQ